ncbi:MAG: L-fuconolactonase [Cyclobacteriaceae bacterium]|jgi:L-fuconolactonase
MNKYSVQANKINRRKFVKKSALGAAGLLCQPAFSMNINESGSRKKSIQKTDTHVHLFDLDKLKYPWLKNASAINRSFSLSDFQEATKEANVGNIIFVESGAATGLGVKEARWVSSLAKNNPRIKGIVAKLDLSQGLEVSDNLKLLTKLKLLKGIRCAFLNNAHESESLKNGMGLLASNNLAFDILVSPGQLENVTKLVKKCPENTFILDHMGNPDIKAGEFSFWKEGINKLAIMPNVNCKISGIVTKAGNQWDTENLRPYLGHVIDKFGPERLVYGGDWPVVLRASTYLDWSTAFEKMTHELTDDEKLKIYQQNADRIYNL